MTGAFASAFGPLRRHADFSGRNGDEGANRHGPDPRFGAPAKAVS